jgi:hypothetical protein
LQKLIVYKNPSVTMTVRPNVVHKFGKCKAEFGSQVVETITQLVTQIK